MEIKKRSIRGLEQETRDGLLKLLAHEPMNNDQLSWSLDVWYADIRDLTVRLAEEGLIHGTVAGPRPDWKDGRTNEHILWHLGPGPVPEELTKRATGVLPLFLDREKEG